MNFTHRFLKSFNEVVTYINVYFDDFFWNDLLNEALFDSYIESGWNFVLFENKDTPYALLAYKLHENSDTLHLLQDKYEILLFEVSDRTCGKGRGFGSDIIKYFKENIATDRDICGFSVAEAAPFWKKVSTEIDVETFSFLEQEEFEGEALMYFKISQ